MSEYEYLVSAPGIGGQDGEAKDEARPGVAGVISGAEDVPRVVRGGATSPARSCRVLSGFEGFFHNLYWKMKRMFQFWVRPVAISGLVQPGVVCHSVLEPLSDALIPTYLMQG